MSGLLSRLSAFTKQYPVARGMLMYFAIWPTSSLIQQTYQGKRYDTYDWLHCMRFCLFGSLFVAPTLYGWVRTAQMMWPNRGLKTSFYKAAVEQISYTPFAMIAFYFGMGLLEFQPLNECIQEVHAKFAPTYKVGLCVWPVITIINFTLIPERNRILVASTCSSLWTYFLSYMKNLKRDQMQKQQLTS